MMDRVFWPVVEISSWSIIKLSISRNYKANTHRDADCGLTYITRLVTHNMIGLLHHFGGGCRDGCRDGCQDKCRFRSQCRQRRPSERVVGAAKGLCVHADKFKVIGDMLGQLVEPAEKGVAVVPLAGKEETVGGGSDKERRGGFRIDDSLLGPLGVGVGMGIGLWRLVVEGTLWHGAYGYARMCGCARMSWSVLISMMYVRGCGSHLL